MNDKKQNEIEDLSFLVVNAIINNSTAEETAEYLYKHNYSKQSDTIKEFAEKLKDMVKPLRDLEIAAIRESREYNFIDEKARRNWLSTRKETAQAYDTTMRFIDNLLKQYEVVEK